jgi:hypothetical protein
MSEATLTAAVPVLQAGAIVLASPHGVPQLAIVADLAGSDTAQVITAGGPGESDDLITQTIAHASLMTAPDELDAAQQDLARRLTLQFAAQASEYAARLRADCIHLQGQAEDAYAKIASMRAYAIGKHLDGEICRDGLNGFLAAHDLDLYEPRYTARVTITVDVEVDGAEDSDDADSIIRDCVEATSSDDAQTSITWDHGTTISHLHPIPGD